jgi:hypothetical protein
MCRYEPHRTGTPNIGVCTPVLRPIDVPEGALDVKRACPGFLSFSFRLLALIVELGARLNRVSA